MCRRVWVVSWPWPNLTVCCENVLKSWHYMRKVVIWQRHQHIYISAWVVLLFLVSFIFFYFNWFFLMIENMSIIESAHKKSAWTFIETHILLLLVYKICLLVSNLLLTFVDFQKCRNRLLPLVSKITETSIDRCWNHNTVPPTNPCPHKAINKLCKFM